MIPMSSIDNVILHHSGELTTSFTPIQHYSSIRNTTKARYGTKYDLVYHSVVAQDGQVFSGQKIGEVCPHCGVDIGEGIVNNWNSIGICCVGNFEIETMGKDQFNGLVSLLRELKDRYHFTKLNFYKHKELCSTSCPGKNYPFEQILSEVFMEEKIYPDVSEKDWFYKAVKFCKDKGFMNGDEFGFRPDDPVTRAELAAVIYKIFHQEG